MTSFPKRANPRNVYELDTELQDIVTLLDELYDRVYDLELDDPEHDHVRCACLRCIEWAASGLGMVLSAIQDGDPGVPPQAGDIVDAVNRVQSTLLDSQIRRSKAS